MRTTTTSTFLIAMTVLAGLAATPALARAQSAPPRPSVFQTTLEEAGQKTPEITTDDLLKILAEGKIPVIDVRTAEEYAIAHIPGSINVYELEAQRITEMFGPGQDMILYCNGPSCGKSKRTSEDLVKLGYTNIRRYQLGMPVWRALSQTVQTDMGGLHYMFTRDGTAVFVDARTPAEFSAASMPNAAALGVMTGLLEVITFIGPIIAGTIVGIVALSTGGPTLAITAVVFLFVLRQFEDVVMMPAVLGRAVHLHPLVALFAVVVGSTAFGVVGTFLGLPVAAAISVAMHELYPEELGPLPDMTADAHPPKDAAEVDGGPTPYETPSVPPAADA